MKPLSPLVKGVITAALMLITTLIFYYTKQPGNSGLQYIIYGLYGAGILWTLFSYAGSSGYSPKFAALFGQAFRCFIVITLIMVTFTGVFSMTHPEMAEESAANYKEYLVKEKKKLPAEIEEEVATAKKHFTTGLIYVSIFGYLIIGTVFTAAGAALVLMRRK